MCVMITIEMHLPHCCHCCSARGCVVVEVVAVCAAPCIRFGRYNAFLLLFQIEESEGNSVTTVTRGTMELTGESVIFYGWKWRLFD